MITVTVESTAAMIDSCRAVVVITSHEH